MTPFLDIFGKQIPVYGLLCVIGAGLGVFLALLRRKRAGIAREDVIFSATYGIIGGIVGAKLLYILTLVPAMIRAHERIDSYFRLFAELLTSGGFVFYGGLIGGILMAIWYCKRYGIGIIKVADLFAPSLALAHGFGRIGCFLVGCCYGKPVSWGYVYHGSVSAPLGVPLFPVQLLEAFLNLLLCFLLLWFDRHKKTEGKTAALYVCLYCLLRFFLEFLRGDAARGLLLGLSLSQYISAAGFLILLFFLFRYKRQEK